MAATHILRVLNTTPFESYLFIVAVKFMPVNVEQ